MSGDVQPRKRKDKKRKRDSIDRKSEGDLTFSRKASLQSTEEEEEGIHHGVHATKMGTEDIHLHVQSEHGTGGHWCAKIFFFSLFAILIGLIGLIIMENRGLSDLDTPLSESRFSEYFEGWVDEHRDSHDHDPHDVVAHEIEEHEEHDEPFEEEEDVSEPEEEVDEDHDDEDEEHATEEEKDATDATEGDDEDEDDATQEENATLEDKVDKDDEPSQPLYTRVRREAPSQEAQVDVNEAKEHEIAEETKENDVDDEDEDDDEDDEDTNDDNEPFDEHITKKEDLNISQTEISNLHNVVSSKGINLNGDISQKVAKEEYDGTYENVIDNDAEELKLLQQKARQAQKDSGDVEPEEEESQSSPQIKARPDGGPQSFETEDEYMDEQLRRANKHMLRDNIETALKIYESLILKYPDSHGALLGKAEALDKLSEKLKSNDKLKEAITSYKRYLAFGSDIQDDEKFRKVSERCIERMRFLGLVSQAIVIHEGLIERFQNESKHQNDLAVTYLLNNQLTEAKNILRNILKHWPNDGFAKVHYGFVLKNLDKDLENAVQYLRDGINSNENGTQDGRFYFNLGEALQRLNRSDEAIEIFRKGAKRKLYPSVYQRSLYNVNNLRAKPFWLKKDFPNDYQEFFAMLERNWRQIREEGINALNENGYFVDEIENLKDKGDWKQFELYVQGIKKLKNCEKARVTCALIDTFSPARYCKRGQTKFSVMHPGTHVWPHCGPTNCRLRAHLGIKIPSGTRIRVATEEKTWNEGKFLIFDDSFEHEVWHNGTNPRLVLIIDIWHPDLTELERKSLSPI